MASKHADIDTTAEHRCFGGTQGFYRFESDSCGPMDFGLFLPPAAQQGPVPAVYYLAGLTCTPETFAIKAGAQRVAAELGLALVMPDTSPRATGIDGATEEWDFGEGAGFYVDATAAPWSERFRMETHVVEELPSLIEGAFPVAAERRAIFGHSMGGHGALTLALRHPDRYTSVSAFAPIVAPTQVPWGQKALPRYLGDDESAWRNHDACELVIERPFPGTVLIDQGEADPFLAEQLQPERFESACGAAGQALELRRHPGYDHGYFFIASFVDDHLRHHARALGAG
jgi:S-formylglutathione hydrolase